MSFQNVQISERKVRDYLLSPNHLTGRSKEAFFRFCGFERKNWRILAAALRFHAQENPIHRIEENEYGLKAIIEGPLISPLGKIVMIRSVWFLENENDRCPRLVTAYPLSSGTENVYNEPEESVNE